MSERDVHVLVDEALERGRGVLKVYVVEGSRQIGKALIVPRDYKPYEIAWDLYNKGFEYSKNPVLGRYADIYMAASKKNPNT